MADNYDSEEELDKKLKLTPCQYTEREQKIIELLKQGKTLKEIAGELKLSYVYLRQICGKLPK
jgi:DNA-binding NarL/FixJ family response regulator